MQVRRGPATVNREHPARPLSHTGMGRRGVRLPKARKPACQPAVSSARRSMPSWTGAMIWHGFRAGIPLVSGHRSLCLVIHPTSPRPGLSVPSHPQLQTEGNRCPRFPPGVKREVRYALNYAQTGAVPPLLPGALYMVTVRLSDGKAASAMNGSQETCLLLRAKVPSGERERAPRGAYPALAICVSGLPSEGGPGISLVRHTQHPAGPVHRLRPLRAACAGPLRRHRPRCGRRTGSRSQRSRSGPGRGRSLRLSHGGDRRDPVTRSAA